LCVATCTLMVFLAGRTKAGAALKAKNRLDRAGANLLDTVVNDRDNPSLKQAIRHHTSGITGFSSGLARKASRSQWRGLIRLW
jgi:hypothetical protein